MMLRGYRSSDVRLLTGPWLPGEIIGRQPDGQPAVCAPVSVTAPQDSTAELCVVPDSGFVRYCDIDWVHRRARLEIGLQPESADPAEVLDAALAHGFRRLNLHRLYGWVTPAAAPPTDLLSRAGFAREASVPDSAWLDGRPAEREIWGAVRHD